MTLPIPARRVTVAPPRAAARTYTELDQRFAVNQSQKALDAADEAPKPGPSKPATSPAAKKSATTTKKGE